MSNSILLRKFAALALLLAFPVPMVQAESTYFKCVYGKGDDGKDSTGNPLPRSDFLLDSGRKKAYVTREGQKLEVMYFVNTRDKLVTFVEITPERNVRVTVVDAFWSSTQTLLGSVLTGHCEVK